MNSITTQAEDLVVELTITDPEVIAEMEQYSIGNEREQFALKAIKIGVLALKQARGQIDADAVRREGEKLMSDIRSRLEQHEQLLNQRMGDVLKEYFDPESGRFQERVAQLIKEDGELERTLKKQIAGDDSALARTLLSHIGEESRLMKLLNPEQSQGLLSLMKESLDEKLHAQRQHVLNQFSLDDETSPLSRLVRELKNNHGELSDGIGEKIDELVKEFSFNEENSALSRLVKNVKDAQEKITKEFSLDNDESSLVRLQKTLTETLKAQQEANQKFQEEVKEALAAMKARKEEAARSTRHGFSFEDNLYQVIEAEAMKQGDIAQHTGNTTGLIKGRKYGDAVVELSPESAAAGARIVIEAKEVKGYDLATARSEIGFARENRGAQVGIFVFSRQTAPECLDPVVRIDQDIFVIWDAEDETSDLYLQLGFTLAKALCVKAASLSAKQQADFDEIDKATNEITKQIDGLVEIETWAENIKKQGDKIIDRVARARSRLTKQNDILRENIDAIRGSL